MTEREAIQSHISENIHRIEVIEEFLSTNSDANDKECRKNIEILTKINKALNEVHQFRAIGTPDECRAAVEKQKEMIAYCDENDCSDCPYHSGNQKENRCMNDFIAEQLKVGVDNEQID